MQHGRWGLRRLAILFAVATVGVLAVGANAASAQVIEICKSSANGMSGRTFQYSISGGASVSVNGGRCSGPITVAAAQVTITEAASNPATDVKSTTVRPSLRKVSEDLTNRSVTVTTGASTSSETLVTFTNQPAGGSYGTLKVCKLTETPAYLGRLFSFSVNGGPLVSTEANDAMDDPANWSCRILGTFQVGSVVTVHEQIPAGSEVQYIDSDPATALGDFNTSTGDAVYTIGAGVTIALYDDEPLPPSGTGWLEICKDAAWLYPGYQDPDVHGPFQFSVTDSAGATYSKTVLVGQCSEPFQVAAGISEVTEGPSPGYDLVDVQTIPQDRLLTTNLINRTADVEVPASDSSNDETQVHFFNQTQRAQLKLCKTLGPGSSDLIGQKFAIDWTSDSGATGTTWITAAASTQCVIVGNLPIGATVALTEENPGAFVDVSGPSSITLTAGINTATYTNTARGLLEICKHRIDSLTGAQPSFSFRIDGAGILSVRAGTCSLPQRVTVGSHTVTELTDDNYELDPDGADLAPSYVTQWGSFGSGNGQFNVPVSIAVDAAGNVYVVDQVNDRVEKFDANGTYLTQWGGFGSGNGQFSGPTGIAVDSAGNVYVVERGNNRVQKFTNTGTFLTKWGVTGSGNGQFFAPFGVAVDSAGNVYVADSGNNRVQKFTSTGAYITQWGTPGSGPGQFNNPLDIAVDAAGNVYVVDSGNSRVEKFTSTGTFLAAWGTPVLFNIPIGITLDAAGNVYVADTGNNRIQKFTSDGAYLTQWGSFGTGPGQFNDPLDVAVDAAGNAYVVDAGNSRIQKFAPVQTNGGIVVSPADREISRNLNTRTVTVNVPYGPAGETAVTYFDRAKLGRIKICKTIPTSSQDALGGKTFTFTAVIHSGTVETTLQLGPIGPGECTLPTAGIPVVSNLGGGVAVIIDEDSAYPPTTFQVTGITCTGCRLFATYPAAGQPGEAQLLLGPGTDVLTFTNKALDP